jgi:1,4-dihydroxy-2-naphthoate octaprenyltransferase
MVFIYECVLAARPYSFTAAIVPILVTTALLSNHRGFSTFTEEGFVRALTMGIFVQSAANLTNTCKL